MTTDIKYCFAAFALVILLAIVGKMDSEGEEQDLATYCKHVQSGNWPDYKKIYKSSCKAN